MISTRDQSASNTQSSEHGVNATSKHVDFLACSCVERDVGLSRSPEPMEQDGQLRCYGDYGLVLGLLSASGSQMQTPVDDAITPASQDWAFEVHPEVSFWAMNNCRPMPHGKKSREGKAERVELLTSIFPGIEEHILRRPVRVGVDDLLDAAAAAWSALRFLQGTARCVCPPERDDRGLEVTIRY